MTTNTYTMKIKDKNFKTFISEAEIQQLVAGLAGEISRDYAESIPVVCPVLTGAFMFATDLVRRLSIPCEVSFVRYASYSGLSSTGNVKCLLPFPPEIEGRDVIIVEDIVDSGLSMKHILQDVRTFHPRSVKVCALFYKPAAFKGDYKVDYIGREIGNEFIVGYGLDYDEQGRNIPEILVVED